ncbi:hypothetical protein NQU17_02470 [Clostridiaceae bacterium HFYG-1003]|nr:hypothetical protein NQU17_02470 [Clostridiaceae bacterium HFYG-1003]
MTAKEYLRQLIDIDEQIKDYQDEILKVRTGMERITPQMSGMPMGSPDPDKLAGHMDGLIMWENKLNAAIDEACRLKAEALTFINQMQDQTLRKILFKHYIAGKPFTLISVEMSYDYYWTCRLHGMALQGFDEILKEHKQTQLEQ